MKDVGGVQAQVASAAEMQCAVRAPGLTPGTTERALAKKRLVKAWGMRGTLHWFATEDFPVWAAALSARPRWNQARETFWKKEFGLTWKEVSRAIEVVAEVVDGKCMTRDELAKHVYNKMRNTAIDERLRSGWGDIVKIVALRGGLCFGPNEGRNITFARADQWVPSWRDEDPAESVKKVLRRYLASHGPATKEEFARWWGFAPADARKVIESIEDDLVLLDREGDKAYALKSDLKALLAAEEDNEVRLLGFFDAYTLAGLPHDQIIPKVKKNLVYRTGAWVWPTVIQGGRVVGAWKSDRKTKGTNVEVQLFKKRSVPKAAIAAELEALEPFAGPLASVKVS